MIDTSKIFRLLEDNNISTVDIRRYKILSESTLQRLRGGNVSLTADNLNHLCALFNCQPSDLLEYKPDKESEAWAKDKRKKLGR